MKSIKDSREEALSRMISIRKIKENLRKCLKDLKTTKMVVISVVSQVTLQRIAKLKKPLSS